MLINKVYSTIKKYHLIRRGERILIGVSGGPDSVALLLTLNDLKKKLNLEIFVAHLNHGLRAASKKEEKFVESLCKKFEVDYAIKRIRLNKKASLEENARKARYNFFSESAKKFNADRIALAHTKDDQAETVLMRLLRGSGLSGLGAIPKIRKLNDIVVVRPFIEVSKKEIIKFLKENKQKYFVDASNSDNSFYRNRIRNELLPYLRTFNSSIDELLSNTADNLSHDYDFIRDAALKIKGLLVTKSAKDRIWLDSSRLCQEHLAIQRMVVRICIESLCGNTRRLTYKHWQEIEALISGLPVNSVVNLPNFMQIKKIPSRIIISRRKS